MADQEFLKNNRTTIRVICHGDLAVGAAHRLSMTSEDVNVEEDAAKGVTVVTSHDDLVLGVPADAVLHLVEVVGDLSVADLSSTVTIGRVAGGTSLAGLSGTVSAEELAGDLSARQCADLTVLRIMGDATVRGGANVSLQTVHGDVSAHSIGGSATLQEVMGDVALRDVRGDVTIGVAHGDVSLRDLGGSRNQATSDDDIRISGPLAAGKHTFKAASDIVLRWPEDAPLALTATAPRILSRVPLSKSQSSETTLSGYIGSGDAAVELTAAGRIVLKADKSRDEWVSGDIEIDLEGLGERISAEINSRMGEFTNRMAEFSTMFGADNMSRFESKAERAAAKAERAIEKAMRRLEQRMAQAEKRSWRAPTPPPPPPPPSAKADTSAEQMKILKMLEDGVITVEQANQLLDALS